MKLKKILLAATAAVGTAGVYADPSQSVDNESVDTSKYVDRFICVYPELDKNGNQIYIEPDYPSLRAVFEVANIFVQDPNFSNKDYIDGFNQRFPNNERRVETGTTYSMNYDNIGELIDDMQGAISAWLDQEPDENKYVELANQFIMGTALDQADQYIAATEAIADSDETKFCAEELTPGN